jgi:hypothetical protein
MNSLEVRPQKSVSPSEAAARYQRDGFCIGPTILPSDLIQLTVAHMDAVMRREYETGVSPLDFSGPNDSPTKLRKIDQPHYSDRTIFEAVTYPGLGRAVAEIVNARMIQIWAVQLLFKPPGGDVKGAIGLHQDLHYWKTWWTPESNIFTAWLALSDVREECGPMHFAAGSHRWGLMEGSNFHGAFDETSIEPPSGEEWKDESGAMPAGAFSLHHRLTFHGSRPNTSSIPRYSFAIHLRTEDSQPIPVASDDTGYHYVGHLDDTAKCPVIYRA